MGFDELDPFGDEATIAPPTSAEPTNGTTRERALALAAVTGMSLGMPENKEGPPVDLSDLPDLPPARPIPAEPAAHIREYDKPDPHRLLPATQYAMAEIPPVEWVRIGRFLQTLVHREPLQTKSYDDLRLLLSTFVAELFMEARAAGEPQPEATPDEIAQWEVHLDKLLSASSRSRRVQRGQNAGVL